MRANEDITPRSDRWQSAHGEPDSPLQTRLFHFPSHRLDSLVVSSAPAVRWTVGALGAGLAQAATAVSAREDVGPVELSLAASAAALGVHLYGQGVRQLLTDVMTQPEADRMLAAATALGGLAGAILGTGVASTGWPPGRIAGVALLVGSTAAVHHALGQAFVAGETALDQHSALACGEHPHAARATAAMLAMAVLAAAAGGYGIWASPRLGAAEAAGLGLLCHALLGTAWSTRGVVKEWRERQAAAGDF